MTTPTTPADATTDVPVCQCCPRRLLDVEVQFGRLVCRPCERRLDAELVEVATLWTRLPALLRPGASGADNGDAPRPPGPTGSKPPANLAVLSLLGGGVTDLLLVEEDAWRREWSKTGPYPPTPRRGRQDQTLRGTVQWLRDNLYRACHNYPDVDDLDRTLRKLLGEMRGLVSGDRRRREELTASCPMPARGHDEDDSAAPKCGGTLAYDPRKAVIGCGTCHRTVPPAQWGELGAAAGLITLPFTVTAA
ncbi:hypothetical protein [Streptomyces sp. SP17KL33]|uniref:hypothetical protein n=1 Tax=Streptomyces sp. SP17KL33 TaxID=3002534 RepID=UPI002E79F4A1|nr:hypothetical protein [Streptomyces sp. SP17KL33]MEE1838129.1 hypothetical protein [Streptomyces sp. SP17KL33]